MLGHAHSGRTGEGRIHETVSQRLTRLRQQRPNRIHSQGMVTAVTGKQDLLPWIANDQFDGGRANIDSGRICMFHRRYPIEPIEIVAKPFSG